jgi:uncharacterized protein YjdB
MKKLFTLILALAAFAIGAKAETVDRIVLEIDFDEVIGLGKPLVHPQIRIIEGSPAYVEYHDGYHSGWHAHEVINEYGQTGSEIIYNDGNNEENPVLVGETYRNMTGKCFTEGTWSYLITLKVDKPDAFIGGHHHVTVILNGKELDTKLHRNNWKAAGSKYNEDRTAFDRIILWSPEIDLIQGECEEIHEIEAVCPDLTPVAGESGEFTPTFTVTKGMPAYLKRNNESHGWYDENSNRVETFEEGHSYVYKCFFSHYSLYYKLTEPITIKVNDVEWTPTYVHYPEFDGDDDATWGIVQSPPIPVTSKHLVYNIVATATPDLSTIPDLNNSVTTKPKINVTTGAPAYFYINDSNGKWQKKSGSNWQSVNSGNFSPGSWRFYCQVRIEGNAANDYMLTLPMTVKVNGVDWQVVNTESAVVDPSSSYTYIWVASPEYTVNEPILPTSVSLNLTSLSLNGGQTYQLKATVLPENATDKTVTWTSSDTNVATVSTDGLVTAVNGGTATITATTTNGKTATCTVKVVIPPTGITLDKQELAFDDVGLTYQLTATVLPENATNKTVTWTSSHPDVATVDDNGLVTAKGEGITFIYAYTSNSKMAYCKVTVGLVKEGTLGTQGFWSYANGVLTVDYIGQMPWDCTRQTTDPEVAYRLKWIDFLSSIDEVVITGQDVEIQPYFLYYEGDGPGGSHPDDHIKKLTLGSGVKKIGRGALALYDLKDVYCYGIEAPELSSDTGGGNCFWKSRVQANAAFLHLVPGASTDYARTDREWTIFNRSTNYLDPADDPVGVKSLTPDPSPVGEGSIYDLSGRKVSKPQKGFNIIRYSDGSTRKVLVK